MKNDILFFASERFPSSIERCCIEVRRKFIRQHFSLRILDNVDGSLSRLQRGAELWEEHNARKAVVRMPGDGKKVTLAGKPNNVPRDRRRHKAHVHVRLDAASWIFDGPPCSPGFRKKLFMCWRANASGKSATKLPGMYLFIPPGAAHASKMPATGRQPRSVPGLGAHGR